VLPSQGGRIFFFGPAKEDTAKKWTSQGGHGKILDQPGRARQYFGPANTDMKIFWTSQGGHEITEIF
jgi:hypothetical protein